MKLLDTDIATKEVLSWKGVHLLHFPSSSCSQKTRIFLNLKGINWDSHIVDIAAQKNHDPWYLGINPRGLVPTLVHDGEVHIESNDIILYLEQKFPEPKLILSEQHDDMAAALHEEDDLHMDLRSLTMRFILPRFLVKRKPAAIAAYEASTNTINGVKDPHKEVELAFWREYAKHGTTDKQARESFLRFKVKYDQFEQDLKKHTYLQGDSITLLDIAWFIYTHRLLTAGYPFSQLHSNVFTWYQALLEKPEFRKEIAAPLPLKFITKALHMVQFISGTTLKKVAAY